MLNTSEWRRRSCVRCCRRGQLTVRSRADSAPIKRGTIDTRIQHRSTVYTSTVTECYPQSNEFSHTAAHADTLFDRPIASLGHRYGPFRLGPPLTVKSFNEIRKTLSWNNESRPRLKQRTKPFFIFVSGSVKLKTENFEIYFIMHVLNLAHDRIIITSALRHSHTPCPYSFM